MHKRKKTGIINGGVARAQILSQDRRTEIATRAAIARWGDPTMPKAVCGSDDRPLKIGDIEIQCYVLEDGTRVLTQRGLQSALGMSKGGGKGGARKIVDFLGKLGSKGIEVADLRARADSPLQFIIQDGGSVANGYRAEILADICDAVLDARQKGVLSIPQQAIAIRCEMLARAFQRTGIIAVIDEHTGYQEQRAKNALSVILEKFIASELRKWIKTFPIEFYREMFRLRGWKLDPELGSRPSVVGRYTNDVIYARLAPGVLDELQRLSPKNEHGRRNVRMFQWLSSDVGHPKLQTHIEIVVALMMANETWDGFIQQLDRAKPKFQMPPDAVMVDVDVEARMGTAINESH